MKTYRDLTEGKDSASDEKQFNALLKKERAKRTKNQELLRGDRVFFPGNGHVNKKQFLALKAALRKSEKK